MMIPLCCKVLDALRARGMTLVTAESLTGGGIGSALTAVSGASEVYKGGVISYVNEVKRDVLGVPQEILDTYGAVSARTAGYMGAGVRKLLGADIAVAVTGLAGPGGDEFGNPVGMVYICYDTESLSELRKFNFKGSREEVRDQTILAALELILEKLE